MHQRRNGTRLSISCPITIPQRSLQGLREPSASCKFFLKGPTTPVLFIDSNATGRRQQRLSVGAKSGFLKFPAIRELWAGFVSYPTLLPGAYPERLFLSENTTLVNSSAHSSSRSFTKHDRTCVILHLTVRLRAISLAVR